MSLQTVSAGSSKRSNARSPRRKDAKKRSLNFPFAASRLGGFALDNDRGLAPHSVPVRYRYLGDDWIDDAAADVGEAVVATGIAVGQLFVIETQKMQDRGVQVVHVDFVLHGFVTELVCRAV